MKILINKLILFGKHGVYEQEKEKGQEFEISLKIKLSKNKNNNDSIESTLDYSETIKQVTEIFNGKRYNLIESMAKDICNHILNNDKVKRVWISIKKTKPPINIKLGSVEVQYRLKK